MSDRTTEAGRVRQAFLWLCFQGWIPNLHVSQAHTAQTSGQLPLNLAESNHEPKCSLGPAAVSCGLPPAVGNGTFHANRYTVGSQVSYGCDQGHRPDPDRPLTAVCLEDGSWSNAAAAPRCLRECRLLPASTGADCSSLTIEPIESKSCF